MKIGILSDIHSNLEALKEIYATLVYEGCEHIYCLGDVIGYGPNPKECINFIRTKNIKTILGNHDQYVIDINSDWPIKSYAKDAILWTRSQLGQQDFEWLRCLPMKIEEHNLTFIHASLDDTLIPSWPYILDTVTAGRHFFFQKTPICFFGHVHIPLLYSIGASKRVELDLLRTTSLTQNSGTKYLINVGSVGQPRDSDDRASAVVFDTDSFFVKLLRITYDVKTTYDKILSSDLPAILADRLLTGK